MSSESPLKFTALYTRLDRASSVLRERGCLLQSIARRYYLIHATATHLAAKLGIVPPHRRDSDRFEGERFSHGELPDVVCVLYTGLPRGGIAPGDHAGIVGAVLRERQAARYVNDLQRDRKHAGGAHLVDHA